jgi:hypothetical protein
MFVKKLYNKLHKNIFPITAFILGCSVMPLFFWSWFAEGFLNVTNSLVGLSAVFTAWWAYRTFAFKERINEYKNIYEGLKNAESAYSEKYGAYFRLLDTLSKVDISTPDQIADYKNQMNYIEMKYKQAEDFLNDLFFSPFVSNNFKAQLLLLIRTKQFSDASEVQDAFFKIKVLHQEEFIIKTG